MFSKNNENNVLINISNKTNIPISPQSIEQKMTYNFDDIGPGLWKKQNVAAFNRLMKP